jgi:predicted acylesterase/phospholipase RssA
VNDDPTIYDKDRVLTGGRTMHRGLTRLVRAAILPALVLCGCATVAPVNVPVGRVEPETGYRIAKLLGRHRGPANNPDALVFLAFSGGGTRAAALSYGVLEELRRTPIMVKGHQHSMLDEVDLVAGVSGGSFTALAYALYGERLFDEYQDRFLKRNVQGGLIQRILNPANWPRLARDGYGRSELAADYYDEILFGGAIFSDLIPLDAPVVVVTGTDLSTGARFEFSQDTFDPLCSDLGSVRLARAAATSSAVPVLLSPVTYRNYGGKCNAMLPIWVQDVANKEYAARPAGRALSRYRDFKALEDSANRPYLHIVDGGVSDNLGLRGMLVRTTGGQSGVPARDALLRTASHCRDRRQFSLGPGHRLGSKAGAAEYRVAADPGLERSDRSFLLRIRGTLERYRRAVGEPTRARDCPAHRCRPIAGRGRGRRAQDCIRCDRREL